MFLTKSCLFKNVKFKISHISFCIFYSTLLYSVWNGLNFDKIVQWFYFKGELDYLGLAAFYIFGLCIFICIFTLFAHRWIIKPLAIILTILSAAVAYFIAKYDVALDHDMVMNAMHTDVTEVRGLLSLQMLPYFLFLIALPLWIIFSVQITFAPSIRYLLSSILVCVLTIIIATGLLYAQFDSIHRAANMSHKYTIHQLVPINYIRSIGSIIQEYFEKRFSKQDVKKVEIAAHISSQDDLVVVLVIGESARQKNFSLYGYTRKNTNPILSKYKDLHLLNGIASVGSTLYALPKILVKNDVPLVRITSKVGINTACYVNFTLYDNCDAVGETHVEDCGHNGSCYDEDVVPLLDANLKSYTAGYRFVVLHLGGGSHGPSYHTRHPPEFQVFHPMCLDADVVNKCTIEQLYNSYDNTILYVDYILGDIINRLDQSGSNYVFIYLSDHGESLLENDRIFHGMPPGIPLPPEQAQIPLIVKSSMPLSIVKRRQYMQQDIFDTILELFSIETNISNKEGSFIKKIKNKSKLVTKNTSLK